MRLLLDTNRYQDVVAHDLEVAQRLQRAEQVFISLISVGELLAGFASGTRQSRNEARLRQFVELQDVSVLGLDFDTARHYADVSARLRRLGKPIPANDMWIAAQALQHDLTLDTRDEHFRAVPGLRLADSPEGEP
jgi:predicted nucleic acid-binding protein